MCGSYFNPSHSLNSDWPNESNDAQASHILSLSFLSTRPSTSRPGKARRCLGISRSVVERNTRYSHLSSTSSDHETDLMNNPKIVSCVHVSIVHSLSSRSSGTRYLRNTMATMNPHNARIELKHFYVIIGHEPMFLVRVKS